MKKLAAILIGLIVLGTGISLAPQLLLDRHKLRDRVASAFLKKTGLQLSMKETSIQLLPWPSFQAVNVVLTRPGCAPFVAARSVHVDISLLALLQREISFQDFTVEGAGIALHRASEGQCSSWLPFLSQGQEATPADSHETPEATSPRGYGFLSPHWKISFGALHLSDSDFSWQDDLADGSIPSEGRFHIDNLVLEGMRSDSPWVDLRGHHGHTPLTIRGRMGPLKRLLSADAPQDSPWSFSVGVTMGGSAESTQQNHVTLDGTMKDAHHLTGVTFSLQGQWADLRDLGKLFPRLHLPVMQQAEGTVTFRSDDNQSNASSSHADIALTDALLRLPRHLVPGQIHVHLAKLSVPDGLWKSTAPLDVSDLQLDADAPQAPLFVQGQAVWGHYGWVFHSQMESLQQALLAGLGAGQPQLGFKMELQGQDRSLANLFSRNDAGKVMAVQDHVNVELQGKIGLNASALEVHGQAVMLQLPDMAGLSGLLVHNGQLSGQVELGSLDTVERQGLKVQELHFDSQEVGGQLSIEMGAPLGSGLRAIVHLAHLDSESFSYAPALDEPKQPTAMLPVPTAMVSTALRPPPANEAPAPQHPETTSPSVEEHTTDKGLADAHSMAVSAEKAQAQDIQKLPSGQRASDADGTSGHIQGANLRPYMAQWLGAAGEMSLDIDLLADQLHVSGVGYQDVHLHLVGNDGRLGLSVLGGNVQAIPLAGEVVLDGSVEPMRAAVTASPIILPASWVQNILNQPVMFEGPLQFNGHVTTQGADPAALGRALEGKMGASLVDGRVHREFLAPLAGPAATLLKLGSGNVALRCVAGVAQFEKGQMQLSDLALEVKHLSMTGQGAFQLAEGGFQLHLKPHVSLAGVDFSTQLKVVNQGDSFRIMPMDRQNESKQLDIGGSGPEEDSCAISVRKARNGQPGLPLAEREQGHLGGAKAILRALGLGGN